MVIHQQLDRVCAHALGFFHTPARDDLCMTGGCVARVAGGFKRNDQPYMIGNTIRGNGLRRRDFRSVKQRLLLSQNTGNIKFKTGKFTVVYEAGLALRQVLAMIERQGGESATRGSDLLQSAEFTDGYRFHVSRSECKSVFSEKRTKCFALSLFILSYLVLLHFIRAKFDDVLNAVLTINIECARFNKVLTAIYRRRSKLKM